MTQLLPFRLGLENYALAVTSIQEVVENEAIFPFPAAPEIIKGVIGFHGRIVPLISLPALLGFSDHNLCQRFIVLTNEHGPIALAVDQIKAIITLNINKMKHLEHDGEIPYIKEVISSPLGMINLFDLEELHNRIDQLCSQHGGLHG